MTAVDAAVIAWMTLWAIVGASRGLVEQALSFAGLVAGALAGSRLAPELLPGGRESLWLPLASLAGALVGAVLVQTLLLMLAAPLRRRMLHGAARTVDQGGGVVLGALLGLALAWLIAAVAIYQPGDRATALRREVQRSAILSTVLHAVPPGDVLGALARVDPFPLLPLPAAVLPEPDPSVARSPATARAARSVVQLRGQACGLLKQGTGWVVGEGLVATNAHVVAGGGGSQAILPGGRSLPATPVYVDGADDVAIVRVAGLRLPPLVLAGPPGSGQDVVLLGHPGGGPLVAEAATAAAPRTVLSQDAYGRDRVARSVVATRGTLGPGSSGGPVIDDRGRVVAMIFGASPGGESGAAVPPGPIRRGLASPLTPVDPGPCA
ncbi:CvpA family protein [Miltoncostaea marina]|uniref:CvpA family protein n=1 Tax=Miltoncostaea marina TaxID=2843215 RepID=UPI001C3D862E|nr:CvpA family protein [Miltoncostaea marina]